MTAPIRITGKTEQSRRTGIIHLRASLRSSKTNLQQAVEAYTLNPSVESMWKVTDKMGKYDRIHSELVDKSMYPCEIDLSMDLDYERDYYERNSS